ncbi:hypothetical protein [Aureimonas sp. AU20]|uniref:hypothetical protein n=1 Tax=Aureimonas sp. AU20 TaxID=1349819 RepID=UPI000721044A|nr:hypothetical protein [Aureimonas sp. AU20]ALN74312.1 hypothetical protein M673_16415 [Aureimonas sp. AU20]
MIATRSLSLLLLLAGFVIWSSAFIALYAGLSVGCAFGWDQARFGPVSLLRALLVGIWLLHLLMLGALWLLCRRRARQSGEAEPDRFLAAAALTASIAAVVVTLVNYAPILNLTICL